MLNDTLYSKLFNITESLSEQSYEEALPYRCDFQAEKKKAQRYSDAELFAALKDAIEASKVSVNAGKYTDQASVYRKELQKRGFSIDEQDKQLGISEAKLNEQDDEDEDVSDEPATPEMDIPDEDDDSKAVTVDEPKEEDEDEELQQEENQTEIEEDEPEKQYFGKSDDDSYFYLNKGDKGYYITDAEGKIVFPSGKDQQEEAPSDDVIAFISEAQKELDVTEISSDIFTRYFEPAINKERKDRDEEEGYTYEDAEADFDEQSEEDEFADKDDGEGNFFDTRRDSERPVPVENRLINNMADKLFENTKYKPILVSGITESHRDAALDEDVESEIEDRSDHPQTLFENLHSRLFEMEDWIDIEEGKNNPGKRDGTGPYKASRQRKFSGKACVNETVQELIHEVPELTEVEKKALQWAIDNKKIKNEWPKPAKMLSRLKGFDLEQSDEDDDYTEADLKVDYLRYVLSSLAFDLYIQKELDKKYDTERETNEAFMNKRWRVWQVGLDSIGEVPAKTMFAAVNKFADTPVHFIKGQGTENNVGVYVGDNGHEYHAYLMGLEETKLDEGLSYAISTILKDAGIPKGYYTYSNGYLYIRSPKTTKEEIEAALKDAGFEDIKYDSSKHAFKLTVSAIKDSKLNEVKFIFNNYEFDVELVDESESGTIININDVQTFEFSPEFTNLYKDNGQLTDDSLKELAQSALANLEEDFFEEIASAGEIAEPEEDDYEEQWDEPVEERVNEALAIRDVDTDESPSPSYLDIGHKYFSSDNSEKSEENYMWYFDGEHVQVAKETKEVPSHVDAFAVVKKWDDLYSGRYESATGKISIHKPYRKRFLDVPNIVISRLQDVFPEAVYLYVFS